MGLSMSNGILAFPADIVEVAFHGIDDPALHLLHNAYTIHSSVLAFALIIPIEKDQVTRTWFTAAVLPQSSLPGPLDADEAACELWNDVSIQIAALVGAPGSGAGTPIHPVLEAISGPIGPTAYIAELGEGYCYDLPITCADAIWSGTPHTVAFSSQ